MMSITQADAQRRHHVETQGWEKSERRHILHELGSWSNQGGWALPGSSLDGDNESHDSNIKVITNSLVLPFCIQLPFCPCAAGVNPSTNNQ